MRHNRAGKWMRRWDNRKYLTTHEELPVDNGTIWCPKITIQRGKLRTVPGNCAQTHPLDVPVYWSVQEAPFGHTFPMRVQAVRSVDVLISIPTAVAFKRTQSELQKILHTSGLQKTKYLPELSLHMVGSWTAVLPVTTPGPTTAYPKVANESEARAESQRISVSALDQKSAENFYRKSVILRLLISALWLPGNSMSRENAGYLRRWQWHLNSLMKAPWLLLTKFSSAGWIMQISRPVSGPITCCTIKQERINCTP